MACELHEDSTALSSVCVGVVQKGEEAIPGWLRCAVDENLWFDTSGMESYFFVPREPVLHDAFVVGTAVEFCDRIKRRPAQEWRRHFFLKIPVHDPDRWLQSSVANSLRDALEFLTGDYWCLRFYPRKKPITPRRGLFDHDLDCVKSAVVPFSNGLDSCMAAGLAAVELGDRVVRVRLHPKRFPPKRINTQKEPFLAVPYEARKGKRKYVESSARSRGFKFALVGAIAAYLCDAEKIIIPESGQGALGPSLIPVGQTYPDYRSHPRFGRKMEEFLRALIGFEGRYCYPHIWYTKGETLARFIEKTGNNVRWMNTQTCWQQNRHASVKGKGIQKGRWGLFGQQNRHVAVKGKVRQCGICAACMLRRMSVHAADQTEPSSTYVWENLFAREFRFGASPDFDKKKISEAMRHHAVAGVLHMDHLAGLQDWPKNAPNLDTESHELSQSLGIDQDTVEQKMQRLLTQHKYEWEQFVTFLGPNSFIARWVH